jgi:excisionase family DNA binding protein
MPDTSTLRIVPAPAADDRFEPLRERRDTGMTVSDVARRLRVGQDKVRAWIARGELLAVNTAANTLGKPRWVITPEAIAEFERKRSGWQPPKRTPRRRRQDDEVDYFPD